MQWRHLRELVPASPTCESDRADAHLFLKPLKVISSAAFSAEMLMLESRMVLLGLRTATLFLAIFTVEVTSPGATQRIQMKRQYRRRHRICRLTPQFLPRHRHSLLNQMQKFGSWVLWQNQLRYEIPLLHKRTKCKWAHPPTLGPKQRFAWIVHPIHNENKQLPHVTLRFCSVYTATDCFPHLPRSS